MSETRYPILTSTKKVFIDVLQLNNLHKMETVLSAVSVGSNVDFLYEEKEAKIKAQEVVKEPKVVEKTLRRMRI